MFSSNDNKDFCDIKENIDRDLGTEEAMDSVYTRMQEVAAVLVFKNSALTSLSTTLLILNACRTFWCTFVFVLKLFGLLHYSVLPQPGTLPNSEYKVSS